MPPFGKTILVDYVIECLNFDDFGKRSSCLSKGFVAETSNHPEEFAAEMLKLATYYSDKSKEIPDETLQKVENYYSSEPENLTAPLRYYLNKILREPISFACEDILLSCEEDVKFQSIIEPCEEYDKYRVLVEKLNSSQHLKKKQFRDLISELKFPLLKICFAARFVKQKLNTKKDFEVMKSEIYTALDEILNYLGFNDPDPIPPLFEHEFYFDDFEWRVKLFGSLITLGELIRELGDLESSQAVIMKTFQVAAKLYPPSPDPLYCDPIKILTVLDCAFSMWRLGSDFKLAVNKALKEVEIFSPIFAPSMFDVYLANFIMDASNFKLSQLIKSALADERPFHRVKKLMAVAELALPSNTLFSRQLQSSMEEALITLPAGQLSSVLAALCSSELPHFALLCSHNYMSRLLHLFRAFPNISQTPISSCLFALVADSYSKSRQFAWRSLTQLIHPRMLSQILKHDKYLLHW